MPYKYTIPKEFEHYRHEKVIQYKSRGRSMSRFLMDIDCEFYEWMMINEGVWEGDSDWRIDARIMKGTAIDVKFISKYYNISPIKMCNILAQRHVLSGYLFMEWAERPDRPLREGDEVSINQIGYIDYETLVDNIRPSKFNGHYVDVRKLKL